ncbi:MAG: response regulator [Alphaproteobacteria bacterium]|nr:response regulator [Alphaproteobacteria bacterium]
MTSEHHSVLGASFLQNHTGGLFEDLMILVVGNRDGIRSIIMPMLRDMGVGSFNQTANGQQALEWLNGAGGEAVDLVICDLEMDVMDGTEFCNRLRRSADASLRKLPVVVVTGNHDELVEEVALQVGAVEVIHKPISISDLGRCIERTVGISAD